MATLEQVSEDVLTLNNSTLVGRFTATGPFNNPTTFPPSTQFPYADDTGPVPSDAQLIPIYNLFPDSLASRNTLIAEYFTGDDQLQRGDEVEITLHSLNAFSLYTGFSAFFDARGEQMNTGNRQTITIPRNWSRTFRGWFMYRIGNFIAVRVFNEGLNQHNFQYITTLGANPAQDDMVYNSRFRFSVKRVPADLFVNASTTFNTDCIFLPDLDNNAGSNTILAVDPTDDNKIILVGTEAAEDKFVTASFMGISNPNSANAAIRNRLSFNTGPDVLSDELFLSSFLPNALTVETTTDVDDIQFSDEFSVTPNGTQVTVSLDSDALPNDIIIHGVDHDDADAPSRDFTPPLSRLDFADRGFTVEQVTPGEGEYRITALGSGSGLGIGTDTSGTATTIADAPTRLDFDTEGFTSVAFDVDGNPTLSSGDAESVTVSLSLPTDVPRIITLPFTANTADGSGNFMVELTHNLNTRHPLVTVYDSTFEVIIPMDIVSINVNTIRLVFPINTVTGNVTFVG